jgi:hypothetical protein
MTSNSQYYSTGITGECATCITDVRIGVDDVQWR